MKQIISTKQLSAIIFLLSIVVAVKLLWLVVSILFLPTTGEELQQSTKAKSLYYRVRLSNERQHIAPVKNTPKPIHRVASMRGYKLLGLYNSKEKLVATVEKNNKTEVLARGESTRDGFKLVSAGANFVIFKKNAQEFRLSLENTRSSRSSSRHMPHNRAVSSPTRNKIVEEDGVKHIPKSLLTSYTKDMDKIWRDVGLAPYKKNGKIDGFKVNFVKRGSDIEKLGLRRGDILKAVNAEPLTFGSAMSFFNDINNLDNLTLTVERNGKSEDLEYEIQ
jgi:general secretion pathway protein C